MASARVDMTQVEEAIREKAREWTKAAGDEFVTLAKDRAPRKTGDLIESIEAGDVEESGDSYSVTVECGAEYGLFQDEGTGGSEGNPLLVWEDGGELIFARRTSGVPATRFWSDTVEQGPDIWQSVAG